MGRMATIAGYGLGAAAWWAALGAATGHAQVNTETLRLGAPEQGLHGDFSGDLALKRGNVELLQTGANGRVFYHADVHTPLLFARAELAEQADERFTENTFVHARWTAMWWTRVGSEMFGQLQYDAFVRLKFRALIGAGPRFALLLGERLEVYAGTGYMLEREVMAIPETDSHPRITLNHRSTTYVSVKLELGEVLNLSNVAYIQPRFDRPADFRVLEELQLAADVSERIALVHTLAARYDSDPPDQVKKLDLGLTVGVRAAF